MKKIWEKLKENEKGKCLYTGSERAGIDRVPLCHTAHNAFIQSVSGQNVALCPLWIIADVALQNMNKTIPEGTHSFLHPSVAWSVQEQNYFFYVA